MHRRHMLQLQASEKVISDQTMGVTPDNQLIDYIVNTEKKGCGIGTRKNRDAGQDSLHESN